MNLHIVIDGEAYPCYVTAGAMLRFKRESGREVTEMQGTFEDMLLYLYCCVKSASRRERKDFSYAFEDFADAVMVEDINRWNAALQAEAEAAEDDSEEKKSL